MSDNPNTDEDTLFQWAKGLKQDGRQRRRAHAAQWWENIATYAGDLWSEFSVHDDILRDPIRTADHKVKLPINLAQPAVRSEYSKLLKNRPIVNALARSSDKEDLDNAEVGTNMLNYYGEERYHKARTRRRMLMWTLITGYAGMFVDWVPNALGEVDVIVDANGDPVFDPQQIAEIQQYASDVSHRPPPTKTIPQGDLRIIHLSPFQLIFDFSKLYIEEAAWCIVSEVHDVDYIFSRWGVEVEQETNALPDVMERRLIAKADLTGTMGLDAPKTQNLAEVHRLFVKPGHRYFQQGAEIVFTDSKLIDMTEFPHYHGELPVAAMGHIPFPISQSPMSILQALKPVVLEISKTESQLIENRNMMSNPPWIEFRQNRIVGEIQNKPGMRLKVDFVPGIPEPHPIQMPDMPDYVKSMPEMLENHVLTISGQNETSQGQVPPGARSGVAIAYLTEENDTKLGPTVQEFEEAIERASWLELMCYAQYFTTERIIRLYKKGSKPEVIHFKGEMLASIPGVQVQAGSALPKSLAAKQQYTLDLYDRGLIRNPRQVMEMLDLGQGEQDEWEIDMDQADRENFKMSNGEQQPVLEWYNHAAHLYVHHSYMKSPDYEDLDSETQGIFVEHEQEHQAFITQQAQNQTAAQQGPPSRGNGPAQAANGQNQGGPQGPYSSPDDIGQAASGGSGPPSQ